LTDKTILLRVIALILVVEALVILGLVLLPQYSTLALITLNGLVLTICVPPLILRFVIRPHVQEIRQRNKKQRKNQDLFQQGIDAFSDSIILYGKDERVIFSNDQYHKNFPDSPAKSEIIGTTLESLLRASLAAGMIVHPLAESDPEAFIAHRLKERREAKDMNAEVTSGTGKTYLYRQKRTDDGSVLVIQTDITSRKQAEKEMLKSREEAEKANKTKSEFLASMSHELRTPMNAVLGFAQMLQIASNNPLSPKQHEYVESILVGGNHLLKLINEVLDLAKIESDESNLDVENFEANPIVAECVEMALALAQSGNIVISDQFSDHAGVLIRADKMRLKQALINLLANAVKYNRDGGTVAVKGRETDDGFLRICIADTGLGIAAHEREGVFELFHRVGVDSMKAREGTGIGLTVCKLLLDRMGGRIGVESEEGVGSEFWIELPLV